MEHSHWSVIIITTNTQQQSGGGGDLIQKAKGVRSIFRLGEEGDCKQSTVNTPVRFRVFLQHCKEDSKAGIPLGGRLLLVLFEEEVGWAYYCLEKRVGEGGQGLFTGRGGGGGSNWSAV